MSLLIILITVLRVGAEHTSPPFAERKVVKEEAKAEKKEVKRAELSEEDAALQAQLVSDSERERARDSVCVYVRERERDGMRERCCAPDTACMRVRQ